jgi:type I site-specific restriction-modification system R (restriction) subunit
LNESFQTKYQNNILSVMRQVKYSKKNENSLDMVIFLNGLPIATLELKDQLTGSGYNVEHAIRQYQTTREPGEPLFRYGRCLVHFAVDEDLVYMATELKGDATFFLPFNKGNNGDAGNPSTYDSRPNISGRKFSRKTAFSICCSISFRKPISSMTTENRRAKRKSYSRDIIRWTAYVR